MSNLYAFDCQREQHGGSYSTASSARIEGGVVVTPRRTRVYVASPMLGSGNPYGNIHRGLQVGTILMDRGYAPYLPQLTAMWEMSMGMRTRDEWLALDKAFLLACDCLLRLDGVSPGADQEVTWAREAGIPVHYSLDMLLCCEKETR